MTDALPGVEALRAALTASEARADAVVDEAARARAAASGAEAMIATLRLEGVDLSLSTQADQVGAAAAALAPLHALIEAHVMATPPPQGSLGHLLRPIRWADGGDEMDDIERGAIEGTEVRAPAAAARERRMTAGRKREAVLRLLRGEPLELVARELAVKAADLSGWRDAFLEAGEASLKSRARDDCDATIGRLRTKLGELTMDAELLTARACPRLDRGSTGWRPAAAGPLSRRGRLRDERRRLDLYASPLRHSPGLPGVGRRALGRLPQPPGRRRGAHAEAQAGACGSDGRRGPGRGDQADAGRQPLPWAEG